MEALTTKEILAELKKLGIATPSELNAYLKEYKTYSTISSPTPYSRTLRRIRWLLLNLKNITHTTLR